MQNFKNTRAYHCQRAKYAPGSGGSRLDLLRGVEGGTWGFGIKSVLLNALNHVLINT